MSKSIGRVFGIGSSSPYGYETNYMQYLRGYNPYNYEQTLQNMMPSAVNNYLKHLVKNQNGRYYIDYDGITDKNLSDRLKRIETRLRRFEK